MNLALGGSMSQSTIRLLVMVVLVASAARPTRAQVQRGAIRGMVSDSSGHPIAGAQIAIKNTDIRATSARDGRFFLPGVWPGDTEVRAQRVGYAMQSMTVSVGQADTARADFLMVEVNMLDAVASDAAATSSRMEGFQQRRARGLGSFITRAEIDRRHPDAMSDMLRSVSGVSVRSNTSTGGLPLVLIQRASRAISSGTCQIQLYVDGHPYPHGHVDDFPPETVEGLEIYRGGAQVPAEFRADNSGCGMIALWTRDPATARNEP
jgi:hypothetical protein